MSKLPSTEVHPIQTCRSFITKDAGQWGRATVFPHVCHVLQATQLNKK